MDMRERIMDLANDAGWACTVKDETERVVTFSFSRRSPSGRNFSMEVKMIKWYVSTLVEALLRKIEYEFSEDDSEDECRKILQPLYGKLNYYDYLCEKASEYGGMESAFLYGGLHFIPKGPVISVGHLLPESQPERWKGYEGCSEPIYSHDDFVAAAGTKSGLFRCVEDGNLYVACEKALLQYAELTPDMFALSPGVVRKEEGICE